MTDHPRWIRGAGRRPRYVGIGDGWGLYSLVRDLQGKRGLVEQLALQTVGRLTLDGSVSAQPIRAAWARLAAAFPMIDAALLIYTGFYKDTLLSGVVEAPAPLFVKVFAELDDHLGEQRSMDAVRRVLPRAAVLPEVAYADGGIIAYTVLARARRRSPAWRLEDAALELGIRARHEDGRAPSDDVPLWRSFVSATDQLLAALDAPLKSAQLERLGALTPALCVAHGDFTPWNVFATTAGRLAIVDYERVADKVPYADAWHLATQPQVLRGEALLPEPTIDRVKRTERCDRQTALGWYAGYLLEELHQDASDWVVGGRRHPQLKMLLSKKRLLLDATCREMSLL